VGIEAVEVETIISNVGPQPFDQCRINVDPHVSADREPLVEQGLDDLRPAADIEQLDLGEILAPEGPAQQVDREPGRLKPLLAGLVKAPLELFRDRERRGVGRHGDIVDVATRSSLAARTACAAAL
jgi:hypothetical protein